MKASRIVLPAGLILLAGLIAFLLLHSAPTERVAMSVIQRSTNATGAVQVVLQLTNGCNRSIDYLFTALQGLTDTGWWPWDCPPIQGQLSARGVTNLVLELPNGTNLWRYEIDYETTPATRAERIAKGLLLEVSPQRAIEYRVHRIWSPEIKP